MVQAYAAKDRIASIVKILWNKGDQYSNLLHPPGNETLGQIGKVFW
jgi:hypothetical protein